LENFCAQTLGKSQHVDRAMHARLRRLHRIMLVVDRRSWAGEVVDLVDLEVERKRYVVPHELEVMVIKQMLDITARPGEEVVDAYDIGAAC